MFSTSWKIFSVNYWKIVTNVLIKFMSNERKNGLCIGAKKLLAKREEKTRLSWNILLTYIDLRNFKLLQQSIRLRFKVDRENVVEQCLLSERVNRISTGMFEIIHTFLTSPICKFGIELDSGHSTRSLQKSAEENIIYPRDRRLGFYREQFYWFAKSRAPRRDIISYNKYVVSLHENKDPFRSGFAATISTRVSLLMAKLHKPLDPF